MTGDKPQSDALREALSISSELLRCEFGITYLDDALLGMAPGEITLMGARTGGGKTEFATQVVLQQQNEDQKKAKSVLYFALDHEPDEIQNRIVWRLLTQQIKKIEDPKIKGMYLRFAEWMAGKYRGMFDDLEADARSYLRHLFEWSNTHFLYRKNQFTVEDIAEIISDDSSAEHNLFIIDHFHAIKGLDTLEKQMEAMAKISEAAEKIFRPVLVLGQFRKRSSNNRSPIPDMEEFSGSAQLIYIPQNIIVLAPRQTEGADLWETYFHVVKSRIASDSKVFVGVHSFDMELKKYSDRYQIMRHVPYSEPNEIEAAKIPKWAKKCFIVHKPDTSFQKPITQTFKQYKDD